MIYWNCHNGLNQGWIIDQKGVQYPKQPLKNGVKFQIRSRMGGNKALFWHEHIGGNQWRLRIRNHMPADNNQWWTFDSRTRTIRSVSKQNFVFSVQAGKGYKNGAHAVIRPWASQHTQKSHFWRGARKNIRNNGGMCLDVHGAKNTQHRHVTWHHCHNGANQGWMLDTQGVTFPRQPLRDGRRFQIKTR